MRKVPLSESLKIIARGSTNWIAERPIVVSFEVTDSCTCYCRHCDHGGPKDDSRNLQPADYRRYMDELRPCVVQVSGGEPLMRDDLADVVRNIKSDSGLPYIILVSSWSLMTVESLPRIAARGRRSVFRQPRFPGPAARRIPLLSGPVRSLERRHPEVRPARLRRHRAQHLHHQRQPARSECRRRPGAGWGVNICYSAYSARRTGCRDYFLNTPEQHQVLRDQLVRIEERRNGSNYIVSAPTTLDATRRYFETGGAAGCKAGLRFLVVTADGKLQPCSMQFHRYELADRGKMVKEFTHNNTCDECYVAIRSNLDKNFPQLLAENVSRYLSFKS